MSHLALVGNPNVGKSVIFSDLTRLYQKIGNFPGVTVDVKVGKCQFDTSIEIVDLPGIYSLELDENEEKVSIEYLKNNKVDMIINVANILSIS